MQNTLNLLCEKTHCEMVKVLLDAKYRKGELIEKWHVFGYNPDLHGEGGTFLEAVNSILPHDPIQAVKLPERGMQTSESLRQ